MKKLLALLLCSLTVFGETLVWDPNTETNIVQYIIYSRTNGLVNTNFTRVGTNLHPNVRFPLALTNGVPYSWYLTAVNDLGLESEPSDVVSWFTPIGVPPENILAKSVGGFSGGNWINLGIRWPAIDLKKYGVTNYVLTVESPTITNRIYLTTNVYSFASLPVNDYRFYVLTTNSLGVSPLSERSIWSVSKTSPRRIENLSVAP